jgi:hypothetical protein
MVDGKGVVEGAGGGGGRRDGGEERGSGGARTGAEVSEIEMVGKSGRETAGEGGVSMGRRGSHGTQDRHDALSEPMVLGATVSTVNRFMTGADEVGGGEASKARGGVYERWRSGSGREREREREREGFLLVGGGGRWF